MRVPLPTPDGPQITSADGRLPGAPPAGAASAVGADWAEPILGVVRWQKKGKGEGGN